MPSLKSQIESVLFISNQPVSFKRLSEVISVPVRQIEEAVTQLVADYAVSEHGMLIQRNEHSAQMVTAPDNAALVAAFIKEETTGELSRASLETLTIIAYRGPITRAELEQIRGVNCAVIVRNLLMRGLIEATEDKQKMQTTYAVTLDFLKFLGAAEVSDLPDYQVLHTHESIEKVSSMDTPMPPVQS